MITVKDALERLYDMEDFIYNDEECDEIIKIHTEFPSGVVIKNREDVLNGVKDNAY